MTFWLIKKATEGEVFMKKVCSGILCMLFILFLLSGCSSIGDKTTSVSIIYGATSFLSLITLIGYFSLIKKKEVWFFILFTSVFIVNIGYLMLSVSKDMETALLANRIAYLGSVFLPLSMIMIIMNVSKLCYKKWVPYVLAIISIVIFFIAASPGYLDVYYKSVTLENIGGVSVLNKEYGSLHCLYLFYLLSYFLIMVSVIMHAIIKKRLESIAHSVVLIVAVFVNISVWLLEQLVRIDFEFLSVSYIITELFLISAYLMLQQQELIVSSLQAKIITPPEKVKNELKKDSPEFMERCKFIVEHLPHLTPSERAIYDLYLAGKSTKEVLKEMNIVENTLKFHNKNLYSKLGVSSRKQLIEYSKAINEAAVRESSVIRHPHKNTF